MARIMLHLGAFFGSVRVFREYSTILGSFENHTTVINSSTRYTVYKVSIPSSLCTKHAVICM